MAKRTILLADNIHFLLAIQKKSVRHLCKKCGVGVASFYRWIQHDRIEYMSLGDLIEISKYFGVTIDSLVFDDLRVDLLTRSKLKQINP